MALELTNRKFGQFEVSAIYATCPTCFFANRKYSRFEVSAIYVVCSECFFGNRKFSPISPAETFVLNLAPVLDNPIPNQVTNEDEIFDFIFGADTFSDPELDEIFYEATLADDNPLPSWLTFTPLTRRFVGTPLNDDVGTIEVKVLAFNDFPSPVKTPATFFLTVQNINDPPVVDQGIEDQNATADTAFSFQFPEDAFDDVDMGDVLTYTARQAGGAALPAWLSFNPLTRTFTGVPGRGDVGDIDIEVIADDGNS